MYTTTMVSENNHWLLRSAPNETYLYIVNFNLGIQMETLCSDYYNFISLIKHLSSSYLHLNTQAPYFIFLGSNHGTRNTATWYLCSIQCLLFIYTFSLFTQNTLYSTHSQDNREGAIGTNKGLNKTRDNISISHSKSIDSAQNVIFAQFNFTKYHICTMSFHIMSYLPNVISQNIIFAKG